MISDPSLPPSDVISVRGAREHNLKNIDIDIPRGKLVVITGPSGSGKSSLAIDTIFAEGQRQYIETLSTYSRSFIQSLPRADVDWIEGLQPTLCINQFPPPPNPRSTVGTITEIFDYMRILYARVGTVLCEKCGKPIRQMDPESIFDVVAGYPERTKMMVLAPLVKRRRGKNEDTLERIRKTGLLRARVDGEVRELDDIRLPGNRLHSIEAVTDRLIIRHGEDSDGARQRLRESIQLALQLGNGVCLISTPADRDRSDATDWMDTVYSTRYACFDCGVHYEQLEPKHFSFNSPEGACSTCDGLGGLLQFDMDQVVPDRSKSLSNAFEIWNQLPRGQRKKRLALLDPFLKKHRLTLDHPLDALSARQWNDLVTGDQKSWSGVATLLEQELATCTDLDRLADLESFRSIDDCPDCHGNRLGPLGRSVQIDGRPFVGVAHSAIGDLVGFFENADFDSDDAEAAGVLVGEISKRLRFLDRVGLGYLSLDRPTQTLSGGEYQRVRLASAMGSGLSQVCFILDEPTIGLHATDNSRLIDSIKQLRDQGNSVIVVEHDRLMMEAADWIVDMGPEAGRRGGNIVFEGTPSDILSSTTSPTGRYLARRLMIKVPESQPSLFRDHDDGSFQIHLGGASGHNLKDIDVSVPLGKLVCVTGVSGSGKSSLVQQTLAPAVLRRLGRSAPRPLPFRSLEISGRIDDLISIDQRPIGRSPRSNAATYTGVMESIRKIFAKTRDAKLRGFGPSRFSFNSKSGQCPECRGAGLLKVEMKFLPDMEKTCPGCHGHRYDWSTLQVRYQDQSIADVLEKPISESLEFFQNIESIRAPLQALEDIGLGYLSLGQSSSQLSGGEAQRVKLATELALSQDIARHHLYLLDEPTTGLHFADVERLLSCFRQLVSRGHSIVVIEHHEDVIASADHVIELGPGAGDLGGEIIFSGFRGR